MKKMLPVLLLCALMLLSACGKKQAEPTGSISAEESAETQTQKSTKKTGKASKNAKETAMPSSTAAPSSGKSGSKTSGKTNPSATPTPKVENWADVQELQEQLAELIAVNPVGNWIDKSTGAAMVIDEEFRGSILLTQADGTNVVWTFTGKYDLERAELTYTDCKKLVQNASGLQTVYENGSGTLSAKDGGLVWVDETGNQTMTFERDA